MAIWTFKGPTNADYSYEDYQEVTSFLNHSFRNGIARFGWGYIDKADLYQKGEI